MAGNYLKKTGAASARFCLWGGCYSELGTISGFYRFLSSSALSRCSELNLGRDTECSNSTTVFLALGWARKSQPHCLILPVVFFTAVVSLCLLCVLAISYTSESAFQPTSPCFSRAIGSRLFLSSSCWTDTGPDGKKSSALFLLAFTAQKSRAAEAFLHVLPCSSLVFRCQASGKSERSEKTVFVKCEVTGPGLALIRSLLYI